eukprot:TRINITY_DN52572_c0_g1_i1.p3 TRINITY_DN52572_c0_g1~~TRINITY_DN52572_c0_g1_i1.p3  ORF type:complete len:132 (-),score=1.12 TRINITY_DN52572_c0_g1_i1:1106-1501(-)
MLNNLYIHIMIDKTNQYFLTNTYNHRHFLSNTTHTHIKLYIRTHINEGKPVTKRLECQFLTHILVLLLLHCCHSVAGQQTIVFPLRFQACTVWYLQLQRWGCVTQGCNFRGADTVDFHYGSSRRIASCEVK